MNIDIDLLASIICKSKFYFNFIIFSGHSRELVDGHAQFMQGIKPAIGYNGDFGFRRNTPWLRQSPSPFGTASRSPAHVITVEPREKVPRSQTVRAK